MKSIAAAALVAALLLAGCGAKAADQLHDEAVQHCKDKLTQQLRDPSTAEWSNMKANGPIKSDKDTYSYGVEGQLRAANGFGGKSLSNVMCLAVYDPASNSWDVTASTY